MANEISLSASATVAKGLDRVTVSFSRQFDLTGTDYKEYTLTVTDAGWTALDKGSIGDLGLCLIRNLSSTAADVVYVSRDGGTTEHEQLGPGAWLMTWLRTSATIADVKIKAAAGKTVLVKVHLVEA